MTFKPALTYDMIVNIDERVVHRHLIPPWRSWKPRGGEAIAMPADVRRWLERASGEEAELFWDYLATGKWRKAKRMAGVSDKSIEFLLESMWNDRSTRGSASPDRYMVHGLPVRVIWQTLFSLPVDVRKTIDKYRFMDKPPPWSGVKRDDKMAFAIFADALNEVKNAKW